jgi:SurA N-terminal domain
MRRIALVAAAAALAGPAAAVAQDPPSVPPGLSRAEPISVAGEMIPIGEIEHHARIAARSFGGRSRRYFRQAAQVLISNRWLDGEARAQGVKVTAGQVRRALRSQVHETFSERADFRKYLRDSGQTRADVRARVRLDLISNRLRRRAIGDATDPEEQQRRLDAFVTDWRARWRAMTLCTPRFAVLPGYCANGVDDG